MTSRTNQTAVRLLQSVELPGFDEHKQLEITSSTLMLLWKRTGIHHITAMLLLLGNYPQYTIRNDDEHHERVAQQDGLELVSMSLPGSGTTLIERTFGYGQRTETQ